ncbi:MAG: LMBR1 domain-containing protein [Dolichospermum sp. DL01]|nr:MAG: LMBR1 domain-containing protein [Dolichospermum sp. DL01]
MSVPIYQFCRAFDNVRYSEVYQCYVSGGYAFEKITRASYEVPPEIREAVIDDYFKLNDNYPPDQDDFSLIAREINDKYSVLAVANRQLDDGGRPTIGYKYFWLDKSKLSRYVDGIGTLLYWWSKNEPKFKMEELIDSISPGIFDYDQEIKKNNFREILQYEQTLHEIPEVQVVKKELWEGYPAYMEIHYLALALSHRANDANAWAWNVQKLSYPETFLAISYTTEENLPKTIRKRPLPSPQKDNSNNNSTTATTKNSGQIVPDKKIRDCLKEIARIFADTYELDSKKTEELFEYLAKYPNETWSNFIDKATLKASDGNFNIIYKAEIYLLLPKEKSSFLIEILNSTNFGNSSGKSSSNSIAIKFHTQLLNASYKYQNPQVIHRLVSSIYTGISYLLNHLMAHNNGSNQIDFLLTQSQSIWSKTFLTYAELVEKRIFSQEEITVEESIKDFCQDILTILQEPKNITLEQRSPYKKLASTFIKINYYSLAGTFYYISDRYIPQDILDRIPDEILLKIRNIKPQQPNSPPKNHSEPPVDESQTNETRSKKPKNKPILNTQIQHQSIKHNPIQNEYNTQAFILFVLFLAGSILLKLWKSFLLPPQILLLFVSIIYAILSVIVIHLTIDNFFNRRNHHFKHTNRIIGISLAIFYILVFVSIIWKIDKIPTSINLFGENNQTQLARQDTRNGETRNNIPGENRNISHASPSNNINCPKDALTTFQAFKDCNKNESNKAKLEEELKTQYVLSLPDDTIAGNLIKYYLDSKNNDQFQNRKRDIEKCQRDNPMTDTGNNDKRVDCIKRTINKSKQPKK